MVRKDLGESVAEGILAKSFGAVVVKLLAVSRRRGENFVDGSGDFLVAFGVNQGAEHAIGKSIDRAVAIAGDDGESGGGGFEKDNAEAFFFTRKNEKIGAAIEIREGFVRDEAGEAAMTGNAKVRCDLFDVFKVVAFASEHPMKLGVLLDELGHELQETMVAFSCFGFTDAAHAEHDLGVIGEAQIFTPGSLGRDGRKACCVEGVWEDFDGWNVISKLFAESLGGVVAHR